MNVRQIVLRNREINLNNEKLNKGAFNGVTTRKRAALTVLRDSGTHQNLKVPTLVTKGDHKISPVEREFNIESMDISIDNKENESINYEYLIKTRFVWPTSSEIASPEHNSYTLNTIISRRNAIRYYFKHLNNNGNPIWFPNESANRDEYMHDEYQANIHDYLMDNELSFKPMGRNFLENSPQIGARQRYIFVNWIVQSHSQFAMCAETLQLTIAICDRFIKEHKATIKVEDLIIIGLMSMFIAAKVEEVYPPTLDEMLKSFDLKYTLDFCKQLELRILATLDCKLSIPLPISFIRHYNIIIEANTLSHYLSRFFCELSIQDYEASGHSINMIASSCVFLAQVICQQVEQDFALVWTERLQTSSGLVYTDIRPLVRNLCIIVSKQSASSKYRAISMKYSSERLMNVYNKSLSSPGFRNILQHFKSESRQQQ